MAASTQNLESVREPSASGTVVRLRGAIDDTFDRVGFVEGLTGVVVLDLGGVHRITSYGVREWVLALRTIPAEYVAFINAHPTIVSQFNMVAGFAGRGQLITFFAPHICPACETEVESFVDLRKQYTQVKNYEVPPPVPCPSCGAMAEFDDSPETYFMHVATNPPPVPPPAADAMIDGGEFRTAARWKVEKVIEDGVTALWCSGPLDARSQLKRLADGLDGEVVMIMDQVTEADASGIARLKQFASREGFALSIARVSQPVLEGLVRSPEACGRATLLSATFELTCVHCGHTTLETRDQLGIAGMLGPAGVNCRACLKSVRDDLPPWLARAAVLPFGAASKRVETYLREHPAGPGVERMGSEVEETWGKYRLSKMIGTGGMAQVFLARQVGPEGFEKKVVLKRLLPHLSQNRLFVEMFLHEARVAAKLSHPNIVQIFDLGKVGEQYYIAMEYVRGWDLNAVMKAMAVTKTFMPVHLACRIISDVCAALGVAHRPLDEEGRTLAIVHRDVSPQNILLSDEGVVKLTDFGIAKAGGSLTNTEPGMVRGKVAYMAPEQVRGSADLDGRADLFAAGVILYHLVTGESLFHRENQAATLHALLEAPILLASSRRPGVPLEIDVVLRKALARNRDRRYETAEAMRTDLEAVLARIGQPDDPAALAKWLQELSKKAVERGQPPVVPGFTPTSQSVKSKAAVDLTQPSQNPDDPTIVRAKSDQKS